MPKTTAVSSDTTAVKTRTVGLSDTSFSRGSHCGSHFSRALMPSRDDDQADDGTERREHETLGQQLTDDAPASGADGGAHGQLALPHHALRQQQAADVGARDQQHEACRALQNLERGPEASADHRLVERHDANAPALVVRRLFPEVTGELIGRLPAPVPA